MRRQGWHMHTPPSSPPARTPAAAAGGQQIQTRRLLASCLQAAQLRLCSLCGRQAAFVIAVLLLLTGCRGSAKLSHPFSLLTSKLCGVVVLEDLCSGVDQLGAAGGCTCGVAGVRQLWVLHVPGRSPSLQLGQPGRGTCRRWGEQAGLAGACA